MSNYLKPAKLNEVFHLLAAGYGVRKTARLSGVSKDTVMKYKRSLQWQKCSYLKDFVAELERVLKLAKELQSWPKA